MPHNIRCLLLRIRIGPLTHLLRLLFQPGLLASQSCKGILMILLNSSSQISKLQCPWLQCRRPKKQAQLSKVKARPRCLNPLLNPLIPLCEEIRTKMRKTLTIWTLMNSYPKKGFQVAHLRLKTKIVYPVSMSKRRKFKPQFSPSLPNQIITFSDFKPSQNLQQKIVDQASKA